MTTLHNSKREVSFKGTLVPALLEHTVDVCRTELSKRRAGRYHHHEAVLVLADLSSVDLEHGALDYLACVTLQTGVAKSYLLLSPTVVDEDLDDVSGIALSASFLGSVGNEGERRMRAGRAEYRAHCPRASCVETAGVKLARGF